MNASLKKHYAFNRTQINVKDKDLEALLKAPWLLREAGEKGVLFSERRIAYYLDLEHRLDKRILTTGAERLSNKSTGERKQLLLNYQLSQQPDFLILDRPFDGLDVKTVSLLKEQLALLANHITIIQFYTRAADVLPFCKYSLDYKNGVFIKTEKILVPAETTSITRVSKIPEALTSLEAVPEVLVSFRDVSVSFGEKPVLNKISWEIKKGSCWQLTGPNGSGKTTLLAMITGDSTKGYGKELVLFGSKKGSGESVWEIKQKIGYITPALTERFDGMHTVLDMITGGLYDSVGLYRKPTSLERKIAREWVTLIGLSAKAEHPFRTLAEVEKRLVLIARAMIKHPPLLILDEPTSALGDHGAALVIALINTLSNSKETAIIYVSHREEKGLEFEHTIELIPSASGSNFLLHGREP